MRLWSTPESVRAGELSALAMIETLAAIGASVWIGVHFGTWRHVIIGAAIAPLLLLRTDLSCKFAWRIAERVEDWSGRWIEFIDAKKLRVAVFFSVTLGVVYAVTSVLMDLSGLRWLLIALALVLIFMPLVLGVGLMGPIGRVLGAIRGAFAAPLASIRAMPGNWWRAIAALDFARPPELLPLPDDADWRRPALALDDLMIGHVLRRGNWGDRLFDAMVFGIPAICFRLSLKSTALLWLPLLWALRPLKPAAEPWSAHLKLKATSDINRLAAIFSTAVLSGFVAKYLYFVAGHELAREAAEWQGWLGQRLGEFTAALVRPGEFPIWQFASATNSVLALLSIFLIRHWQRKDEVGLPTSDARIERTLGVMFFFRRLFTSYVIVCNGVVVFQLARTLPLPQIGSKLFPWL